MLYYALIEMYMILPAPSTSQIFDGTVPSLFDPALMNKRKQRALCRKVKVAHMPLGTGVAGALVLQY